jgi:hypothetical protein
MASGVVTKVAVPPSLPEPLLLPDPPPLLEPLLPPLPPPLLEPLLEPLSDEKPASPPGPPFAPPPLEEEHAATATHPVNAPNVSQLPKMRFDCIVAL